MYSWRLIMAPPSVLDYVAAHEVAHLVELNHSAAYWAVVGDVSVRLEAPSGPGCASMVPGIFTGSLSGLTPAGRGVFPCAPC